MQTRLKETRPQGTPLHPLKLYPMQDDAGRIDVPVHWQDTVEILLVCRGRLDLRVAGVPYTGQPGDVFYVNPRQLHGMQTPGPGCRYLAFVFPLSWLQFRHADEADEQYLKPLAEGVAQVETRLPPAAAEAAAALLKNAAALYGSGAPGAWLGIKADILQLYAGLYAAGLVGRSAAGGKQAETLLAIADYIRQHCAEPLTLAVLGRQFHMSPKYFSSYFQRHFYRSFSGYLTAVRLDVAKRLLQETDADIELVAQRAGFSASSYFIRTFRQAFGTTPGRYRRALEHRG